jgi:hypothetical protein
MKTRRHNSFIALVLLALNFPGLLNAALPDRSEQLIYPGMFRADR